MDLKKPSPEYLIPCEGSIPTPESDYHKSTWTPPKISLTTSQFKMFQTQAQVALPCFPPFPSLISLSFWWSRGEGGEEVHDSEHVTNVPFPTMRKSTFASALPPADSPGPLSGSLLPITHTFASTCSVQQASIGLPHNAIQYRSYERGRKLGHLR